MLLPEIRFRENSAECSFGSIEGAVEAPQKPFHPGRYIEITLLRRFQDLVVRHALDPDLRGHTIEALRARFRTGERHVGDGARDSSVAVFKWMDGDEP